MPCAVNGRALLIPFLRQQQFLQRAIAELAGGGRYPALGGFYRRKRVPRMNGSLRRRARCEDLAGFLGFADISARGRAALLQRARARAALGLLRLRRRRRLDDRRQDVMARHGVVPSASVRSSR